jgi:hypothetical protein
MATEKREVSVSLGVDLGPQGTKALKELTDAFKKAEDAYGHLRTSLQGPGVAKVIGPLTGAAAEAAARYGKPDPKAEEKERRQMMAFWTRASAVAGTAVAALNTAGTAASAFGNPYMTGDARARSIAQSIPGVAPLLRIGENLNQRGNKLEAARVGGEQYEAYARSRLERSALEFQYGIPQAGREAAATAAGAASPIFQRRVNRDSAEGERAFREESRLLPIRREMAKATREVTAATAERVKAEEVEAKIGARARELETQRIRQAKIVADQEGGKFPEGMSKEDREKARLAEVSRLTGVENELQGTRNQQKQAADAVFQSRIAEGNAKGRVGAVKAEELEAQSQIYAQRADTYAGSGRRLGGMNPMERQFGLQALQALQKYGPDALPPEMLAAAQQFAPETAGKLVEVHGRGTAEYEAGKKLAPAEFGDVAKARQQSLDFADQAEEQRRKTEATTTATAAEAGRGMAEAVGKFIDQIRDSFVREIDNRLRLRDAQ